MRRVVYLVAASLDGYIAGPRGEYDWIISDPAIDFDAIFARFDTLLMGRRTYELMAERGDATSPGKRLFVFSRTLRPEDHPEATVVSSEADEVVAGLREEETGKDVWLFGGGVLFGSLLEAGLVDAVEVAVIPVLLGGGIPLLPSPAGGAKLELTGHRIYETGIVSLEYAVQGTT